MNMFLFPSPLWLVPTKTELLPKDDGLMDFWIRTLEL
jgi:hypothetical protein